MLPILRLKILNSSMYLYNIVGYFCYTTIQYNIICPSAACSTLYTYHKKNIFCIALAYLFWHLFFAGYQTLWLPSYYIQKTYYYMDGNHSNHGHVLRSIPAWTSPYILYTYPVTNVLVSNCLRWHWLWSSMIIIAMYRTWYYSVGII